MKKTLALLTAVMLLLSACSSATVDGAGKELEDTITNITDADNKYVQMVKGGYRSDDPDTTYEDAFTAFFGTPRWKYFEGEDGQDVVEFTGDCTYQDVPVKARIQFVVDEENGTFEAVYLAFNEVPQSALILAALIEKAFEETETPVEAVTSADEEGSSAANQDRTTISEDTIRFDTEFYSLELPEYWADLCEYSQWDIDPDSFAKSYGITFYEKQSYDDFDGEGGELFSLALYRGDIDEYYDFPDYLYLGELAVIRLSTYDVVATFPTDVQFSEAGQENYLRLSEDIDDILASFTPQSDPECEYTPAA